MKQISVVLAEDEIRTSNRLLHTLATAQDVDVLECTASGGETLRTVRRLEPDLLLLDLSLPDVDGLHVLRQLDYTTDTRTIVLTSRATHEVLTQAIVLGACGAIDKLAATSLLLKSVRSVANGQFWFSRDMTRVLLKYLTPHSGPNDLNRAISQRLTPREGDVMVAAACGLSNRQIARRLDVSEHTVKQHLKQVFEKLKVSSRVELVLYASRLKSRPLASETRGKERSYRRPISG